MACAYYILNINSIIELLFIVENDWTVTKRRYYKMSMDMSLVIVSNFDWWGTAEELKENDKKVKEACEKVDGVKYLGLHVPHNSKYHYTRMWKAESWDKYWAWERPGRDKKKMSHLVMEYLSPANL